MEPKYFSFWLASRVILEVETVLVLEYQCRYFSCIYVSILVSSFFSDAVWHVIAWSAILFYFIMESVNKFNFLVWSFSQLL